MPLYTVHRIRAALYSDTVNMPERRDNLSTSPPWPANCAAERRGRKKNWSVGNGVSHRSFPFLRFDSSFCRVGSAPSFPKLGCSQSQLCGLHAPISLPHATFPGLERRPAISRRLNPRRSCNHSHHLGPMENAELCTRLQR